MSGRSFDLAAIGRGLAFSPAAPRLQETLDEGGPAAVAVVQAPPGSGKTTLVPPLVSNQLTARPGPSRVVVTQPRRVAARAAARRLAVLDGTALGERSGYTVRGDRRLHGGARVEFCTPGVLLRRLIDRPDLPGVGAVVLDEVHERSLDTDLLIGLLAEVRELREDLGLLAMSATLDADRVAALLGAPVIESPASQHPLTITYAPARGPRIGQRGVERDFLRHVAATAAGASRDGEDGLVFLPGAREVAEVAGRLRTSLGADVNVLELHSRRPAAEQDDAIAGRRGGGPSRVVVATSIAESSLTVPGVRFVVDACLAREPRRDAARDMSGLVTVAASRAAMTQRAGRAGRLGPGRAIRCIDERTFAAAPAFPRSQMSVADLTGAALLLACWGTPGGRGLRLLEEPPSEALAGAQRVLTRLGAVDARGRATTLGQRLARVPADPRLARALLEGAHLAPSPGSPAPARLAAEVVALLDGDVRADGADGADIAVLWRRLRSGGHPDASRWRREADRLERLTDAAPDPAAPPATPGLIIALAHPDRVAHRVADRGYLLASGTRAALPPGSPLSSCPWLAIAEVARSDGRAAAGTGVVIRAAAPIDADDAQRAAAHLGHERDEVSIRDGRLTARHTRNLGAIELTSTAVPVPAPEVLDALREALADRGLALFDPDRDAIGLQRRLAFLHHHLGAPWPAVDPSSLSGSAQAWLAPDAAWLAAGLPLRKLDAERALRRLLPWPEAARLEELAPERLPVPSGSRIRVDYPLDPAGRPVVAVKLQECFGLTDTPRVAGGRVPVLFHLLSPAGRPVGVTDDLAGFWAGPYAQVRAQNRGRYPKHPWPEDPATHRPTRLTKRRL